MRKSEDGFIETVGALLVVVIILGLFLSLFYVRFKLSNEVVSGIAYNTTNDRFISGTTCFYVRAGENTYVDQNNTSSYCIPKNSPYKALVNKAAADKRVKIEVQAHKYFTVKAPWTVYPNVTVTEVK